MSADTYHGSWHTVGLSNGVYVGVPVRNKNPVGNWPLSWYYAWLPSCLAGAEAEDSRMPYIACGPSGIRAWNGWAGWVLESDHRLITATKGYF